MRIPSSNKLLILVCSATKKDGPKFMPAIERYDGPLWRTLRVVNPTGEKAQVAFLSAHLGFRASGTPIEKYDTPMTPQIGATMTAGDLGTLWPRQKTKKRVMPSGEHPGMHIASMTALGGYPFIDVALAGGHLYIAVMQQLLALFQKSGYVHANATIIGINGSIGEMRRELRQWLLFPGGENG